jgi:hypothetical protein
VAYKMVAARENQTITNERSSALITLANARIWESEGWQVTITADGKELDTAGFEHQFGQENPTLLREMQVSAPPTEAADSTSANIAPEATDQAAADQAAEPGELSEHELDDADLAAQQFAPEEFAIEEEELAPDEFAQESVG